MAKFTVCVNQPEPTSVCTAIRYIIILCKTTQKTQYVLLNLRTAEEITNVFSVCKLHCKHSQVLLISLLSCSGIVQFIICTVYLSAHLIHNIYQVKTIIISLNNIKLTWVGKCNSHNIITSI